MAKKQTVSCVICTVQVPNRNSRQTIRSHPKTLECMQIIYQIESIFEKNCGKSQELFLSILCEKEQQNSYGIHGHNV